MVCVDLAMNTHTSHNRLYTPRKSRDQGHTFVTTLLFLSFQKQEEGRTALSLALMEQREDIADLIISIDDTDINAPDTIVSAVLRGIHASVECFFSFICFLS